MRRWLELWLTHLLGYLPTAVRCVLGVFCVLNCAAFLSASDAPTEMQVWFFGSAIFFGAGASVRWGRG